MSLIPANGRKMQGREITERSLMGSTITCTMWAVITDTTVTMGRPFTMWAVIMGLMGSTTTCTMWAVINNRGGNTAMGRTILSLIRVILGPKARGVHLWIKPRSFSVSR